MRVVKALALLACIVMAPAAAWAQAAIAGSIKDASGAVLPGVTVEAASPALIEKVRTAVSDGSADRGSAARHLHRDVHAGRVQHPQA